MIEEVERLLQYLTETRKLVQRDARFRLITAVTASFTLALIAADELARGHVPHLLYVYLLAAACSVPQIFSRVALSWCIYRELAGAGWTTSRAFASARSRWIDLLALGLIDGAGTLLCVVVGGYVVIGPLVSMLWWSFSAAIPCALAGGRPGIVAGAATAYQFMTNGRMQILSLAAVLDLPIGIGLALALLCPSLTIAAAIAFAGVFLPLREVLWQCYVAVAYYHMGRLDLTEVE